MLKFFIFVFLTIIIMGGASLLLNIRENWLPYLFIVIMAMALVIYDTHKRKK